MCLSDGCKSTTYHSYTAADWNKLRNQFGKLKANDSYAHASLGYQKAKENTAFTNYVKNKGCIRPFNIQYWILSPNAKKTLLSAFKKELITFYGVDGAPELPTLDFTKQC